MALNQAPLCSMISTYISDAPASFLSVLFFFLFLSLCFCGLGPWDTRLVCDGYNWIGNTRGVGVFGIEERGSIMSLALLSCFALSFTFWYHRRDEE